MPDRDPVHDTFREVANPRAYEIEPLSMDLSEQARRLLADAKDKAAQERARKTLERERSLRQKGATSRPL